MSFCEHRRYEIGNIIGRNEFTRLWVHPGLSSFVGDSAKSGIRGHVQMFSDTVSESAARGFMR